MPGKRNRRRSASTSGVMTPRFSATKGSGPSAALERLEQRSPRARAPSGPPPRSPRRPGSPSTPRTRGSGRAGSGRPARARRGCARSSSASRRARIGIPVVERVPPELAGRAEVVGRHARDGGGLAARVEAEQLGPRPDLDRVVRDVDGHVAEQRDPERAAARAERVPLPDEAPLGEHLRRDLARVAGARGVERGRLAARERPGPARPRAVRRGRASAPRTAPSPRASPPRAPRNASSSARDSAPARAWNAAAARASRSRFHGPACS